MGAAATDLRLRERTRMCGEQRPPSSSVMLSVLPKCLDKKWSSSMVGWKGSWCSRSCEELEDWSGRKGRGRGGEARAERVEEEEEADEDGERIRRTGERREKIGR